MCQPTSAATRKKMEITVGISVDHQPLRANVLYEVKHLQSESHNVTNCFMLFRYDSNQF